MSVDQKMGDESLPSYAGPAAPSTSTDGAAVSHKQLACMALRGSDRLCIIGFPLKDTMIMYTVVGASWPRGIQEVLPHLDGAQEWKLKGYPWSIGSDDGRRMLCALLARLSDLGWVVEASIDFNKNPSAKCASVGCYYLETYSAGFVRPRGDLRPTTNLRHLMQIHFFSAIRNRHRRLMIGSASASTASTKSASWTCRHRFSRLLSFRSMWWLFCCLLCLCVFVFCLFFLVFFV